VPFSLPKNMTPLLTTGDDLVPSPETKLHSSTGVAGRSKVDFPERSD
jgi:hypothetical protein